MTHNDQPLHLDVEYSKNTMWGQRICSSLYTLSFVHGSASSDLTQATTLGDRSFHDIKFPSPVFLGDTLRSESKVVEKREDTEHPNTGIVVFEHIGYNQRDQIVAQSKRAAIVMKRPK
jgi:acyl dehydratase